MVHFDPLHGAIDGSFVVAGNELHPITDNQ
jgi:hypothetical protein